MIYGIWCVVSGGVTGHRESWLKKEGTIMMWTDRAAAQTEADRLTKLTTRPDRPAIFSYTVEERT